LWCFAKDRKKLGFHFSFQIEEEEEEEWGRRRWR